MKNVIYTILLSLILSGCVSGLPSQASIHDGVRCPSKKQSRSIASAEETPTEQSCKNLFGNPANP